MVVSQEWNSDITYIYQNFRSHATSLSPVKHASHHGSRVEVSFPSSLLFRCMCRIIRVYVPLSHNQHFYYVHARKKELRSERAGSMLSQSFFPSFSLPFYFLGTVRLTGCRILCSQANLYTCQSTKFRTDLSNFFFNRKYFQNGQQTIISMSLAIKLREKINLYVRCV